MQSTFHTDLHRKCNYSCHSSVNDIETDQRITGGKSAMWRPSDGKELTIYSIANSKPILTDIASADIESLRPQRQRSDCRMEAALQNMILRNVVERDFEEEMTTQSVASISGFSNLRSKVSTTRNLHPSLAVALLKEKLAKRDIDVQDMFPRECFHLQGRILPQHLRDAMNYAGLTLSDTGFMALWNRFDRQYVGAIPTRHFFKEFDLDMVGLPVAHTNHKAVRIMDTAARTNRCSTKHLDMASEEESRKMMYQQSNNSLTKNKILSKTRETTEISFGIEDRQAQGSSALEPVYKWQSRISLEPVSNEKIPTEVTELHKALQVGFKLYDPDDTGVISLRNFQYVLQKFNVKPPSSLRDLALSRTGSANSHFICYRDYLLRYSQQWKMDERKRKILITKQKNSEGSNNGNALNRRHNPSERTLLCVPNMGTRVQEQRTDALQLLSKIKSQVQQQHEYLKTYFQARDRMGLGHIPVAEIKSLMDRMYWSLTEMEKEIFCGIFDLNNDGRFWYTAFWVNIAALSSEKVTA